MNRLDRRIRLLRGRSRASFDPNQLRIEDAPRARAARLVRGALQTGRPVVVRHARWSAVRWWLDDIAIDLQVSERPIDAHVLDLSVLARSGEAATRIPDLVGRALGVGGAPKAMVSTSRESFRVQTAMVLHKARAKRRRKALLCLGADLLGYERLQDLCDAFADARAEMTPGTSPMLVIACRIGGQSLEMPHAMSFFLPDPTVTEACAMTAELLGAADPEHLAEVVAAVGPVPAFLQQVGLAGGPTDPFGVREALGPMMRELAEAVDIVSARSPLADRLEQLARGVQPFEQDADFALLRAGLVAIHGKSGPKETSLRSPLIRSLVTVED